MRGEMWVKGFFRFPPWLFSNIQYFFPARDRAKEEKKTKQVRRGITEGRERERLNAQLTIQ